jgi:ABC-type nitrate/sulfonate/bicarbonate transport system substrate-binding protein
MAADPQRISLALISEGTHSWPLYVALARELFEREGVRVDMAITGSSVKQLEHLVSGKYDIGFQQSDHVVRAVEQGSDLFALMAHAHAPSLSLVAAPAIASFAHLRGRHIAVDGARTGYALLLRKLLAEHGLAHGDYTFDEIGGSQERYAALKSGAAQATFLNPPFDRNLLAEGFRSLGTTQDFFPSYPGAVAAARRGWAREHGPQLIAFIRALNAGYAWIKQTGNRAEAFRILQARLDVDAKTAAEAYDNIVRLPLPELTAAGIQQVIDIVWEFEGYTQPHNAPDKYLDLSYFERACQAR